MKRSRKHISFMALFYLPTAAAAGSFRVLAVCTSALRAKDIIHCPSQLLRYQSLRGPLESARVDNNSYMSQQLAILGPLAWPGPPSMLVPIAACSHAPFCPFYFLCQGLCLLAPFVFHLWMCAGPASVFCDFHTPLALRENRASPSFPVNY